MDKPESLETRPAIIQEGNGGIRKRRKPTSARSLKPPPEQSTLPLFQRMLPQVRPDFSDFGSGEISIGRRPQNAPPAQRAEAIRAASRQDRAKLGRRGRSSTSATTLRRLINSAPVTARQARPHAGQLVQ